MSNAADRDGIIPAPAQSWTWPQLAISAGAVGMIAVGVGLFASHKDPPATGGAKPPISGSLEGCEEESVPLPGEIAPDAQSPQHPAAILAEVQKLYAAGTRLAEQGKADAAMAKFEEAIELCPGFAPAHCNLGVALYQKGKILEAMQHLLMAFQFDPNLADAHFSLGMIRLAQEAYPEAVVHFREVVRLKPDDADAQNNLAMAFDRQGNIAEAVQHYREVIRINPGNLPVARLLAWYLATCADDQVRNADEAVALAERVVQEAGSRVPVLLDTLAAAYASAGQFDDAVKVAENAVADAKSLWKTALARDIEARLTLYRAKMPYREESKTGRPEKTN